MDVQADDNLPTLQFDTTKDGVLGWRVQFRRKAASGNLVIRIRQDDGSVAEFMIEGQYVPQLVKGLVEITGEGKGP